MACNTIGTPSRLSSSPRVARCLGCIICMPSRCKHESDQLTDNDTPCAAFAQLQAVCSKIMHMAREESSRDEYLACVHDLRDVLEHLDAKDVQAHRQYVLLPLCVILDAKGGAPWHDASLCGTLACLCVLASRCSLDEREGPPLVQRMLAMLGSADELYSTGARQLMAEVLGKIFGTEAGSGDGDDVGQLCRQPSYLSSEQWRPLVGNALSVLLNHPFNDVKQPSSIIGANQTASITALSRLILAAGRQQMAFFVPGIATGLVKRLMMQADVNLEGDISTSKRASGGLVAVLNALEVLLVVTLCDDAGAASEASKGGSDAADGSTVETTEDYLAQLIDLSMLDSRGQATVPDPNSDLEELEATISQDKHALWVDASPAWARATAMRISELLDLCIPRLCIHQNAAVRSQVIRLASGVLGTCQVAFVGHDAVLVEALLLLAQDDWPSVGVAAGDFLSTRLPPRHRNALGAQLLADNHGGGGGGGRAALPSSSSSLLGLPSVIKTRSDVASRHEAARLCSMIEYCRSTDMPSVVGYSGTGDDAVLHALVSCFEIDGSASAAIASAPLISTPATWEIAPPDTDSGMPAMPGALRYITSQASYDIHARIIRLLAIDALRNDVRNPSSTSFSGFVASCVRELRELWNANLAPGACLRAAAVMTVLTEVFVGATMFIERKVSVYGSADSEMDSSLICKAAALDVLYAMQDGGAWRLRTSHYASPGNPCHNADGSENTYADNTILLQRCLVFVGVAARCLKRGFVDDGSCTVTFLLPVVERYASDCQYVSAAAKDTVRNICAFCGYPGGLRDLVTGNMDYVIDGMCTRLQQPSIYPDAPKLFAALMRENGIAVSLIPLLADPAQHMIRGVSILQRREKPENVLAFVMCTQEIALGLLHVSLEGFKYLEALIADASTNAGDLVEEDEDELLEQDGDARDGREAAAAPTSIDEISGYFRDRHSCKIQDENNDIGDTLNVTRDVWEATYLTRNRLEAAAQLSQSIADSLGPLAVSKSLPVAVQSFTATTRALEALQNAHRGLELFKNSIEERLACDGQTPPPSGGKQAPPTFLPSVHLFWTPLVGSLKDWRVPVVETCIDALGTLLRLAPDFLSKRFRTEAWPVLRALLRDGMPMAARTLSGASAGAGASRDASSPALASRIRRAVVSLFSAITDVLNQEEAESLLQPIAPMLLRDVLEHAWESTDQAVADSMRAGFERIATVHPDSAWATLYTYAVEQQENDTTGLMGAASLRLAPESGGRLAPIHDFRQWGDEWWWVTNQLQSLMM